MDAGLGRRAAGYRFCSVPSAPPPSTARGGVGGSVGAFPGGPAGRWRFCCQPAVVRAGVGPLPLSGCWAGSLPSALPLVRRPARYLNISSGGGSPSFGLLPGPGFALLRPLGRLSGPPWARPVRGEGGAVRVGG